MTTINTTYGYSQSIYTAPGGANAPPTAAADSSQPAATSLRENLGVEVTLSPAALQALAQQAAATTPDEEAQIAAKIRSILSQIFLDSSKEAKEADTALPADTTAERKAAAQQATAFLQGKGANPFKGKSLADLAAVIVDTAGKYTTNERRAAFSEFARQDHARLVDDIALDSDFDRKVADAEVPKSNDPARLATAKQATEFLQGKIAKNPFDGLSRDDLTAIINNDGSDYTVNERRAAWAERDEQEKAILDKLAKPLNADQAWKAKNEVPANADEQRLARARQASGFVDGWWKENPFAGLTREELNAIVFDETANYTGNEKRAAYAELKQYLPASAQPAEPSGEDEEDAEADAPEAEDEDPYNTQGAYSSYLMQQVLRSQTTSMFLNILGGGSYGGSGMSLANYLKGGTLA